MMLEWINATLTLFFGERGWKADTESQYSIKGVMESVFQNTEKKQDLMNRAKRKNELEFRHLN